jgi:hypothetical protein
LVKAVDPNASRLSRRKGYGKIRKIFTRRAFDQVRKLGSQKALESLQILQLHRIYDRTRKRIVKGKQMRGKADTSPQFSGNATACMLRPSAMRAYISAQLLIFQKAILAKDGVPIRIGQCFSANDTFSDEEKSLQKIIHTAS